MNGLIKMLFEHPAMLDEILPEYVEDKSRFVIVSYMDAIHRKGIIPTIDAVRNELKGAGENEALETLRTALQEESSFNADYVVPLLREEYNKRVEFTVLNEALRMLSSSSSGEVERFISDGFKTVQMASKPKDTKEALKETMSYLQSIHDGTQLATWKTGHPIHDSEAAFAKRMLVMIAAQQKQGKCADPDTQVIMANGSRRMIKDILVGESVMGPDGKPKKVTSAVTGTDEMFRIDQTKGISYIVNKPHVLSLKYLGKQEYSQRKKGQPVNREHYSLTDAGRVCAFTIDQFLAMSPKQRYRYKGWKGRSDWEERPLRIDPYLMGLWVGDGTTTVPEITNVDTEVVDWLRSNYDMRTQPNTIRHYLRGVKGLFMSYGLLKCPKFIPVDYMQNSLQVRLQVLAGLMDSDGSLMFNKSNGEVRGYEFSQVSDTIAEQVCELARSCGFWVRKRLKRTTVTYKGQVIEGKAWRLWIRGDVHLIPCKVERKKAWRNESSYDPTLSNITVTPLGVGPYAGITVEGELFMLEDHTVVHNTRKAVDYVMRLISNQPSIKVDWFSFEMHATEMVICLISWITGISTSVIKGRTRKPSEEEWKMIMNAQALVMDLPITWHDEKMGIDPMRRQIERNMTDNHVVVIDNLGLVKNDRNLDDLRFDNEVASTLVDIRDKTDSLIFLLHHLSKESEGHFNKDNYYEPTTKHIRGSNKWADCLNMLILLHRASAYEQLKKSIGYSDTEWEIMQNRILVKIPITRDGTPIRIKMSHKLECCQFEELLMQDETRT